MLIVGPSAVLTTHTDRTVEAAEYELTAAGRDAPSVTLLLSDDTPEAVWKEAQTRRCSVRLFAPHGVTHTLTDCTARRAGNTLVTAGGLLTLYAASETPRE